MAFRSQMNSKVSPKKHIVAINLIRQRRTKNSNGKFIVRWAPYVRGDAAESLRVNGNLKPKSSQSLMTGFQNPFFREFTDKDQWILQQSFTGVGKGSRRGKRLLREGKGIAQSRGLKEALAEYAFRFKQEKRIKTY